MIPIINRLNKLVTIPRRYYRFGRRVTMDSFYVSPHWFDKKLLELESKPNTNIIGLDGQIRAKNKIFDEEKNRQQALVTRMEKIQINLEKPFTDGENYVLMMNANISTPYDCAAHIHQLIKQRSALAVVNGTEYWDMHRPLEKSCDLRLLHFKHEDAMPVNYAFWRSCSMLLASVVQKIFREEYSVQIISLPMSDLKGGSFVCDVSVENLPEWDVTPIEIQSVTSLLWDEINKTNFFERLVVNADIAGKLFSDNPHRLKYLESMKDRSEFTIYRVGNHIDLSDGPMISKTDQIGSIYLSAIHPLKTADGSRFYRFQGIALPKQLNINAFVYNLIRNRSKELNQYGLQR